MGEGFKGFVGGISSAFMSLSAEYPAILTGILIIFAAVGIGISASGVFDIIRSGNRHGPGAGASGRTVLTKFIGGAGLIDLAFWAKIWSSSLWANDDVLGIDTYSASSGFGGYANEAMMAALGILVITGYVTLGRAYLMVTKMGHLSDESRSNLYGSIIARIIAGTALISILHLAGAIEASTDLEIITK